MCTRNSSDQGLPISWEGAREFRSVALEKWGGGKGVDACTVVFN